MRRRWVQGLTGRLCRLPFDLNLCDNLKSAKLSHAKLNDRKEKYIHVRVSLWSPGVEHSGSPALLISPVIRSK